MYERQGDVTAVVKKRDSKSKVKDTKIKTRKEPIQTISRRLMGTSGYKRRNNSC